MTAVGVPTRPAAVTANRYDGSQDRRRFAATSIRNGALAATGMVAFYVAVVWGASGSWGHVTEQVRQDWYYLTAIIGGFGIEVALVSELRRRRHLAHGAALTGGVGAGASTTGMIACCAHHIADLLPLVGAASAAGFLTDNRDIFMSAGIAVNAVAVLIAARALHATSSTRQRSAV